MFVMRAFLLALVFAQSLLSRSSVQQIVVMPSTSASTVAKGAAVTLWADVTPNKNIHVYATDKQGFTPLSLKVAPQHGIGIGKVTYPPAETGFTPGLDMMIPIPMYTKPFRVAQAITIPPSAKSGDALTIAGAINYQACDDRLCYPATSLPVTWGVMVK
jgi:cytochrome c biogenesis DsbD-like protein